MKKLTLIPVAILLLVLFNSIYVVQEPEQVIITQFGKPVGQPVVTPGLKFKLPFVQKVHRFDNRFLEWDGDPNELPTRDKRFIWVDSYARWRITDPLLYFQRLKNESGPRRGWTTSSTARSATPSPSTTWWRWCAAPTAKPRRARTWPRTTPPS